MSISQLLQKSYLKDIQAEDLEYLLLWRNQEHIRKFMFNQNIISLQEHLAWYNSLSQKTDFDYKILFIENRPVGIINFKEIKPHVDCSWGFYIGETDAPKGSGTVLAYLGLEHIFAKYNLSKIRSQVFPDNILSINYHYKIGFKLAGEGIIFINKTTHTVLDMYLTRENWDNKKTTLLR